MKIGQITIDSSAKIKPLVGTKDKEGKIVFQNVLNRITDELDEEISGAIAKGIIDAKSIPVKDVVTVVVMKLDQIHGLYQESFRYECSKKRGKIKFTLFWN